MRAGTFDETTPPPHLRPLCIEHAEACFVAAFALTAVTPPPDVANVVPIAAASAAGLHKLLLSQRN